MTADDKAGVDVKGVDAKKKLQRINVRDAIRSKTESQPDRIARLRAMRAALVRKTRGHEVRRDMLLLQNKRHLIEIEKLEETDKK